MSDLMTFGAGFFIFMCAFGIGYFTKRDKLENELDIEIELNVKLLKEKSEWILERAKFRRTLSDPIVLAEILELAKSVDKATSDALRADSFPAQESTSAIPDNSSRAGGNSLDTPHHPICKISGHSWYGNAGITSSYSCARCGYKPRINK